jgi:hypothetical protein
LFISAAVHKVVLVAFVALPAGGGEKFGSEFEENVLDGGGGKL